MGNKIGLLLSKTDSKTHDVTVTTSGLFDHRDMIAEGQGGISNELTLLSPGGEETKWIIELVPKFNTDSVKVVLHSRNTFDVKTKIEMTLVDQHGAKCLMNNGFNVPSFCSFKRHAQLDVWSLNWNTLRQTARYMPNGDLKLNLKLILYGEPKSFFGSKRLSNVQEPKDSQNDFQVFENLDEFYLSKELSDVLLNCQGKSFEAHQVILSASSPVFRAMFQADMKEKTNQHVEIKDLKPDVVSEMLKFIYTRTCVATEDNPNLDMVSDLLAASEKYQMVTLKNVCQTLLLSHLKVANSMKFLVLGDMHTAQKLKQEAMTIVVKNMTALIETEEWKECKKRSPTIIVEVAEAIAKTAS